MMRRWRSHSAPLVMNTEWPRSGPSPSASRADFGKSAARPNSTRSTSAGSLHRNEVKNGVRNSAIQAR